MTEEEEGGQEDEVDVIRDDEDESNEEPMEMDQASEEVQAGCNNDHEWDELEGTDPFDRCH